MVWARAAKERFDVVAMTAWRLQGQHGAQAPKRGVQIARPIPVVWV